MNGKYPEKGKCKISMVDVEKSRLWKVYKVGYLLFWGPEEVCPQFLTDPTSVWPIVKLSPDWVLSDPGD